MKCGQTVRAGSKVAVLVTCKSIFVFFKFILQPFQVVSSKVTVLVTCKIIFVFSSFFKSFKSSLGRSSWSLHRFGFFLTPHLPRYLLIEILVYQEYFIIAALSTYHKNCRCFCVFQISHNAVVTAPNCQYHLMQIERIWRDCKTKNKSWILPVILFCFEFDLLHLKKSGLTNRSQHNSRSQEKGRGKSHLWRQKWKAILGAKYDSSWLYKSFELEGQSSNRPFSPRYFCFVCVKWSNYTLRIWSVKGSGG